MQQSKLYNLGSILTLLFSSLLINSFAQQESYRTNNGLLKATTTFNEQALILTSNQLIITLDYNTGKFIMKQEISSLESSNDSIQQLLRIQTNKFITIIGKLDIDYVITLQHSPMDFKFEGTVIPGNKQIIGSGNLVHMVEGTSAACLLSLSFTLKQKDLFDYDQDFSINKEINVKILQTLMARENEK